MTFFHLLTSEHIDEHLVIRFKTILSVRPERVAYLSCDPARLARDLKQLIVPNGPYQIDQLQPIDFFPQTMHIECLALLIRISS